MSARSARLVERHVELQPVPESARAARRLVSDVLTEIGKPDLADAATLLVSELVTNAILHARTSIEVEVEAAARGVRVGVHDRSPQQPSRRDYGRQATTGRGLEMVDLIAARHGILVHDDGSKTVWFELGDAQPVTEVAAERAVPAPSPSTLAVTWVGLPLRLARAWQQQADAILREYLLLVWELDGDVTERLAHHALASEAFATIAAALDAAPGSASSWDRVDVSLEVEPRTARLFGDLDWQLDAIMDLAERDQMLTPATQPEIRMLRRWLCSEVREQLAGAAAHPWGDLEPGSVPAQARPVDWDTSAVRRSPLAQVAADDANRIIAASPAALALLGWTAAELVGQRIVSVIPPRLREAHIAAFTHHLVTGATTIMDQVVEVPALHRDGHEVPVRLQVRREAAGRSRSVFVATMTLVEVAPS